MKKIRTEKVRNAIKKSKVDGVRKRALEKIREKTALKKEPEFIPGPTVRPDCPSCGQERNGVENHYCPKPEDPTKPPEFHCNFGHNDGHVFWEPAWNRWVHFCATCAST